MANELKKYILSAHIVLMVLLFSACNGKSKTSFMQEGGDTLNLRYAENLQIVKYQHYTQVTLRNPWDTLKTLHICWSINRIRVLHPCRRVQLFGFLYQTP